MAAAAVCLARGVDARGGPRGAGDVRRRRRTGSRRSATVGGVTYVNDSKATNVASAEVGIRVLRAAACT